MGAPVPNEQHQEWAGATVEKLTDMKKIKREYCEQFYARSFERENCLRDRPAVLSCMHRLTQTVQIGSFWPKREGAVSS